MVLIPKSMFVSTMFFPTKIVKTNIIMDIIDYHIFNLKTNSRNLSWFSHFYHMCQSWGFTSLGWIFEFFNRFRLKFLQFCEIKEMIPILLNPFKTNKRTSCFIFFKNQRTFGFIYPSTPS